MDLPHELSSSAWLLQFDQTLNLPRLSPQFNAKSPHSTQSSTRTDAHKNSRLPRNSTPKLNGANKHQITIPPYEKENYQFLTSNRTKLRVRPFQSRSHVNVHRTEIKYMIAELNLQMAPSRCNSHDLPPKSRRRETPARIQDTSVRSRPQVNVQARTQGENST